MKDVENQSISFAFLYTAAMDSLLHKETKTSCKIDEKISWYETKIKELIECVKNNYKDYTLHIMSDHGMTTLLGVIDLKKQIESLEYKLGKDYCAVYDSTMARFWFFNDLAETAIMDILSNTQNGKVLSKEEKIEYKIDFADNMYGKEIFLLDPGWQIEPCDMGVKALPAMHGYSPRDCDSDACFLSSREIVTPPKWVGDYFGLMTED